MKRTATESPANFKAVARNTCRLCAPLGACLAFRGVEGAMPFLHGSQGCATYIRRYMISHFREPLDIASSSFGEESAIFGGRDNLRIGLENVVRQYAPQLIGIATTCLTETIGDDVSMYLHEIKADRNADLPAIVHVSTPSYSAAYEDGYDAAVLAMVETLAAKGPAHNGINVIAPIASPADLRHLKTVCSEYGLQATLVPDYSDTLDGPTWSEYQRIPAGGTPLDAIGRMGAARATIEFGFAGSEKRTAGKFLEEQYGVPRYAVPLPVGVKATDRFHEVLGELGQAVDPSRHASERGRLIDCYVDAHKYVFGRRAVVYGERDLVAALAGFLAEIGIAPVLCASGSDAGRLRRAIASAGGDLPDGITVREDADFVEIEERAVSLRPDLMIGNSKGYPLVKRLKIPLVRVGFPIHDRIDGPRLLHLGYPGAQQLFDRVTNALVEAAQDASPVGYSHM